MITPWWILNDVLLGCDLGVRIPLGILPKKCNIVVKGFQNWWRLIQARRCWGRLIILIGGWRSLKKGRCIGTKEASNNGLRRMTKVRNFFMKKLANVGTEIRFGESKMIQIMNMYRKGRLRWSWWNIFLIFSHRVAIQTPGGDWLYISYLGKLVLVS